VLDTALDKALRVQRPVIIGYLNRVRDRRRDATPSDVVRLLERRYLAAVTAVGAASGGAAAVPGAGTGASLASAALEISAFVEATALFALGDGRRCTACASTIRRSGAPWYWRSCSATPAPRRPRSPPPMPGRGGGRCCPGGPPTRRSSGSNHALARHFLTRFGTKQGALALGRALPLGIGAGIGAAGNAALGRGAITAARRILGPPPDRLPPRIIDAEVADPSPDTEPPAIEARPPDG